MRRNFQEMMEAQWERGRALCVGLDSELEKIPRSVKGKSAEERLVAFNRAIIDATYDIAGFYKPNSAFYEAHGEEGWRALKWTVEYLHDIAPKTPFILDAKRADIGNTNEGYARMAFDLLGVDAITVHPYLGSEALAPILSRCDKGIFVLCRTSNAGAGELQDLSVDGEPLYMHVARMVASRWNVHGNCGLVVGATYPEEGLRIRAAAPALPFLIPGIGAQGGDIVKTTLAYKDERGRGMIISASRTVIFASSGGDFADAARARAEEYASAIRTALLQ